MGRASRSDDQRKLYSAPPSILPCSSGQTLYIDQHSATRSYPRSSLENHVTMLTQLVLLIVLKVG